MSIALPFQNPAGRFDRLDRVDIEMGGLADFHIDDRQAAFLDDMPRADITFQSQERRIKRLRQDDRIAALAGGNGTDDGIAAFAQESVDQPSVIV